MGKISFGLIGCGDIARKRVAPALRDLPNCELLAVNRAQAELVDSFAKEFGAKRWYTDWRELLQDKEIDAVYIATPVYLHAEQTIAAAEAGKHVLCEKPMALDVAECDRMIDACRTNNVKLGIAYYRHFYPVVRRIKEVLGSGEIGTPVVAQINAFEWFDPAADHPRAWLLKKDQSGGGPMFDFGCHRIEVLLDLFGKVSEVKSTMTNAFFKREVEDVGIATFQFEQGVCATLTVAHSAREPQDTLDVFGSKGSLHVNVLNEGTLRVLSDGSERIETLPPASNIHQPLIEDFAQAVIDDREPIVTGQIGRTVAELEAQFFSASLVKW
ncbi:MAG TPA: Gfo/Idh/MocA family oxidoreductase [Pyrinomonadaceae bacterium]